MTYWGLYHLWGRKNCTLWAVFLDNGTELTDGDHPRHSSFVDSEKEVQRGWLFLEFLDGNNCVYMEVYRIDGLFLWRFS